MDAVPEGDPVRVPALVALPLDAPSRDQDDDAGSDDALDDGDVVQRAARGAEDARAIELTLATRPSVAGSWHGICDEATARRTNAAVLDRRDIGDGATRE